HEWPSTWRRSNSPRSDGSNPEFEPRFALMPGTQGACEHSPAIQILPTRTEVHSFGHGRIGVRHEILSERDRRCSFPGEHGDGSGADNASAWHALATADEVIE